MQIAIAHNAMHNAVPNTIHKEGKETSVRHKPRHSGGEAYRKCAHMRMPRPNTLTRIGSKTGPGKEVGKEGATQVC